MQKYKSSLKCPDCGGKLKGKQVTGRNQSGIRYYCNNPDCEVIFVEMIYEPWSGAQPIITKIAREARVDLST